MTLVEVMIAGLVTVLVMLTLLGTISFGLEGTRNAAGHQQGVYHARQLMELIRERRLAECALTAPSPPTGFNDASGTRVPLHAPPFANDFPDNSGYTRRLVTRRVSTDVNDYRNRLFEVEVTVFWKVKARENSYRLVGLYRVP